MSSLRRLGLALTSILLAAPALWAHDFWIEPTTFRPAVAQRLAVRLRVGQEFRGDPVPRDPGLLKRFVVVGSAGETAVPGVPNTEPAGFLSLRPGALHHRLRQQPRGGAARSPEVQRLPGAGGPGEGP